MEEGNQVLLKFSLGFLGLVRFIFFNGLLTET